MSSYSDRSDLRIQAAKHSLAARRPLLVFAILGAAAILLLLLNIAVGSVHYPLADIIRILGESSDASTAAPSRLAKALPSSSATERVSIAKSKSCMSSKASARNASKPPSRRARFAPY